MGIQLDDVGRYSLTPEKEALYIASKVSTSVVVDAFGGCGKCHRFCPNEEYTKSLLL